MILRNERLNNKLMHSACESFRMENFCSVGVYSFFADNRSQFANIDNRILFIFNYLLKSATATATMATTTTAVFILVLYTILMHRNYKRFVYFSCHLPTRQSVCRFLFTDQSSIHLSISSQFFVSYLLKFCSIVECLLLVFVLELEQR